jgi:hypothetical protein
MKPKLLYWGKRRIDELLPDYFIRIAYRNGYSNPERLVNQIHKYFFESCDDHNHHLFLWEKSGHISRNNSARQNRIKWFIEHYSNEKHKFGINDLGETVFKKAIKKKICEECWKLDPYLRSYWSTSYYSRCHIHQCRLQEFSEFTFNDCTLRLGNRTHYSDVEGGYDIGDQLAANVSSGQISIMEFLDKLKEKSMFFGLTKSILFQMRMLFRIRCERLPADMTDTPDFYRLSVETRISTIATEIQGHVGICSDKLNVAMTIACIRGYFKNSPIEQQIYFNGLNRLSKFPGVMELANSLQKNERVVWSKKGNYLFFDSFPSSFVGPNGHVFNFYLLPIIKAALQDLYHLNTKSKSGDIKFTKLADHCDAI